MAGKKHKQRHFLRQWREHRQLTLDQATERLKELAKEYWPAAKKSDIGKRVGFTKGNLSRIERGKVPYNEHLLMLLADAYGTDMASLIMRDPTDPDGIWSLLDGLEAPERQTAVRMLSGLKKTGTGG